MSLEIQPDIQTSSQPKQIHRKHQGRVKRDPKLRKRPPRPFEVIPEARMIMISLDKMRFLTNGQIGELLFRQTMGHNNQIRSESQFQQTANKSIADLIDLGLIERINTYLTNPQTRNVFLGQVNILTREGSKVVDRLYAAADTGDKTRWTRSLKDYGYRALDHELGISSGLIALIRGAQCLGSGFQVLDFYDDNELEISKDQTGFHNFTPDALVLMNTPTGIVPIFFENDRATEIVRSRSGSNRDWFTRVQRYGQYLKYRYATDPFLLSLGFDPSALRKPILLTITSSAERRSNMINATVEAGGAGVYWYAAAPDIFLGPRIETGPSERPQFERAPIGAIMGTVWYKASAKDLDPTSLGDHLRGFT